MLSVVGDVGSLGPGFHPQEASHLGRNADKQGLGHMRGVAYSRSIRSSLWGPEHYRKKCFLLSYVPDAGLGLLKYIIALNLHIIPVLQLGNGNPNMQ